MRLLKKFFSYFRRQRKEASPLPLVEAVSSASSRSKVLLQEVKEEVRKLGMVVNDEASFQNIVNDVYKNQLTESIKEWIDIGSDHGLVEVTSIDEDGEFGYVLTDKGMKFNEVFAKMKIDPDSTEAQSGVIDIPKEDEWVVEILMDMGLNMTEADDDEWLADNEGEMV